MVRRGLIVTATAVVLAGPAVAGAGSTPFCRQLQTVVGEAGRGFAAHRGAKLADVPDDGGGDESARYAASRGLPGATTCGIDRSRADGDPIPPVFLCWFAPAPTGDAAVARIAGQVLGCLGRRPGDRGVVHRDASFAAADFERGDVVLSVTAEQGRPVVLAISAK